MMPQMPPQMPQGAPPGPFSQAAQGGPPPMGGGMPPAPPQGMPPQGGQPPQGAPMQMDPRVILQMINTLPPQIKQMLAQQIMQSVAGQGRNGDSLVAHLTPGEKTVPPEVQTPKVLATLNKAYKDKGVQPQQFTAGSPASSKNPSTGLPEYNFMSSFLPLALGVAGSIAAPELAPALLGQGALSGAAASAIGSGLGTTVGGLAAGEKPTQAALSGLGAGAGGYALGNLGNGLTMGGNAPEGTFAGGASNTISPAQQAVLSAKDPSAAMGAASQMGMNTASPAAAAGGLSNSFRGIPGATMAPNMSNLYGAMPGNSNLLGAAGSAVGGYAGGALGAPPKKQSPNYPPGFNTPMTPVGDLPSAQTQLGQNTTKQPMASFSGFNPMTNYPAAYNFFPTAANGG